MKSWTVLLTCLLLACLPLAGCAAGRRDAGDPDKPRQVCPSTEIGGQAKTFCY